jgi:hypothetical protein
MISYPLSEGYGGFYRPLQRSDNYEVIAFKFRRRFT